jgi:large subunit ribosomal protein L28
MSSPSCEPLPARLPDNTLRLHSAAVSKVCAICGKKPSFGHNRSHSMVATKRRFDPNLQRVRVLLGGKATRAYVCTRCLKSGRVEKAV